MVAPNAGESEMAVAAIMTRLNVKDVLLFIGGGGGRIEIRSPQNRVGARIRQNAQKDIYSFMEALIRFERKMTSDLTVVNLPHFRAENN